MGVTCKIIHLRNYISTLAELFFKKWKDSSFQSLKGGLCDYCEGCKVIIDAICHQCSGIIRIFSPFWKQDHSSLAHCSQRLSPIISDHVNIDGAYCCEFGVLAVEVMVVHLWRTDSLEGGRHFNLE